PAPSSLSSESTATSRICTVKRAGGQAITGKSAAEAGQKKRPLGGGPFQDYVRGPDALIREVGEGLVGLGHLVDVVPLLHGFAFAAVRVVELVRQLLGHRAALLGAGGGEQPAVGQRHAALLGDGHRNLVGRAADAAGADLDHGHDVVDRLGEDVLAVLVGDLLVDLVERGVEDPLGRRLLSAFHEAVDELPHHLVLEFGVGLEQVLEGAEFRGHRSPLLFLGPLDAVLGPARLAVLDAGAVQRAADDVIAHAGQVAHAAAADEHDRVLLEVVAFARDVGRGLAAAREAHAGDLSKSGVRLLGRHRLDDEAHAPLL